MSASLLLLLLGTPLVGAGIVALLPTREPEIAKGLALATAVLTLALGWLVYSSLDFDVGGRQLVTERSWIVPLGLRISVAVDALSLWPLLMTCLAVPMALLGGWSYLEGQGRELCVPLLTFEAGALGVLVAGDAGLLFASWELVLLSSWGLLVVAAPTRPRWVGRWLITAQLGAGLLAAALLMLAVGHYGVTQGHWSLAFSELSQIMLTEDQQRLAFAGVGLAVASAVPVFPVQGWLPSAGTSPNLVASALVPAVLIELGVFVLARFGVELFPIGAVDLGAGLAGLVLLAMVQGVFALRTEPDLGRLAGHLVLLAGAVEVMAILAMRPDAWLGAALLGVGRGLGFVALMLVIGAVRRGFGERGMDRIRGLGRLAPFAAATLLLGLLATAAAPGFAGFAGLLAVMTAAVVDDGLGSPTTSLLVVAGGVGVWVGATAAVGRWQRMMVRRDAPPARRLLAGHEAVAVVVLLGVAFGLGLRPSEVFRRGTWAARERIEQLQWRACKAQAARRLERPERYENIALDCGETESTEAPP